MNKLITSVLLALVSPALFAANEPASPSGAAQPQTERRYLSGTGPKDAVPWEFTVTGGRRAGEKATIPVPSNWEQHGFGTYDYGESARQKSSEHGLYRLAFAVPPEWRGKLIRLVFEGVMTDATAKLNGRQLGPTHHGAFYRFSYDVTSVLKFGDAPENMLEVDVGKASANPDTDAGERNADYWVFGGIFRPVWIEARPMQAIENVAIDARHDGSFSANVVLSHVRDASHLEAQITSLDGTPVGEIVSVPVPAGGVGRLRVSTKVPSPRAWSAETPALYSVRFALRRGEETLHVLTQRFGFRTFEVRPGKGLYLNGERILLRGADRHSFRPDTARSLTTEDCYADARLIRSMNMNAVRMSHYPPDEAFLDACDELGLYVLDELSGWHHAHDTVVGRQLIRAMVERDVNHPCIVFWDNGNEGGWNRELDGEFALHDPQRRRVLHPWELHDDVDTKHYSTYEDLTRRLKGPHLLMPTEVIHALYDGGAGAGLEDYWKAMLGSPFGAGCFIWALADEGVARTDQGGRIDVFSTYAPDGIVGPRHEKEGSYYTVRDLWSPIQVEAPNLADGFDGSVRITNGYDFTNLAQCRFAWRLLRFPAPSDRSVSAAVLSEGVLPGPSVAPEAKGTLKLPLPSDWQQADAVSLTAFDAASQEVWTWCWATPALQSRLAEGAAGNSTPEAPQVERAGNEIRLFSGVVTATFDASTGVLRSVRNGHTTSALTNGPRLAFGRPEAAAPLQWHEFTSSDTTTQTRTLAAPQVSNTVQVELDYTRSIAWAGFKLEITPDGRTWKTPFDASRRVGDGKLYSFPPQPVLAVRLSSLRRNDGQPIAVKSVRLGYAAGRFPPTTSNPSSVSTGTHADPRSGRRVAWLQCRNEQGLGFKWTMRENGTLQLDYEYTLEGEFLYHGITFDHPEKEMTSVRWLGHGPSRVWQNRLRGTWLDVHEIARNDIQPGESFAYPEFQGFFAGLRWARLLTSSGPVTVTSASPDVFLRIGTPRISHQNTTVEFPSGDLSFMHAIPAIGSKFVTPDKSGPASLPSTATGTYRGSLTFRID